MADKKGIAYYKDWIYIGLFCITVIGFIVKVALVNDQVQRNTEDINAANLKVLVYQMGEIEKKVDKILDIIE